MLLYSTHTTPHIAPYTNVISCLRVTGEAQGYFLPRSSLLRGVGLPDSYANPSNNCHLQDQVTRPYGRVSGSGQRLYGASQGQENLAQNGTLGNSGRESAVCTYFFTFILPFFISYQLETPVCNKSVLMEIHDVEERISYGSPQ